MTLNKKIHTTTTKQRERNKLSQAGLQRKIRHLLLLTVSGGTLIAAPQFARAEFTPNPSALNYIATGNETTSQSITEDNVQVVAGDDFSVETNTGTALTLSGAGAIGYNDTNESRLISTGGGALSISSTGDVQGTPGSVTVSTNGTIQGQTSGIYASNQGSGNTNITVEGSVSTVTGQAIDAYNEVDAQDLIVNVGESVNGKIVVYNKGTGQTRMAVGGTVTATEGTAIIAIGEYRNTGMTVAAGAVNSGGSGMLVSSAGSGDTIIDIEGAVNATTGNGIQVNHYLNAQNLNITAESVSGATNGIRVTSIGGKNVDIAVEGSVTGTSGYGIDVFFAGDQGVNVSAGSASGGISGILVENDGYGDTVITVDGAASGTSEYGIDVLNEEGTQNLTVSAGSASGGIGGIRATNNGYGDTSITATGTVTGTTDIGINTTNGEDAQNLTVNANTVTGATTGIHANNQGHGNTSITVDGTVTGTSGSAINVYNGENAQDITVDVGALTGGGYGIYAGNSGTGNTTVTVDGSVTSTIAGGIRVENNETAHDLTVSAGAVTGDSSGVSAINLGTGNTSVNIEGTVTSSNNTGIFVINDETAQGVTVSAGAVSGGNSGIQVIQQGSGETNITVEGTVSGAVRHGITVHNSMSAQDLTITAGSVSGSRSGILALQNGSGNTSITVEGSASGGSEYGIQVETNSPSAQDLTVSAGSVSGGRSGILAKNDGNGDTVITVTGSATGTSEYGIQATNGSGTKDLTVSVGSASGGKSGITATNKGSGSTRITATGALAGESENGIEVLSGVSTQDLTVNVAAVSGELSGIVAQNEGHGNTQITATGTVTGDTAYGVVVFNTANAQDLTVNVADVWSKAYGIYIGNSGSGDTTITATGVVTGDTADGISVVNGETAGNLRVDVADVSGANSGILTFNAGSGTTSVVVNGLVEGGTSAIDANSSGSQAIEITINGTVRNSSQNPAAAAIVSGSGPVVINNNQHLLGTVALGDEGNSINNAGTWQVAGATSSLGEGVNRLDNKAGGTILAADAQGPVSTTFTGADTVLHAGSLVLQNREAGGDTAYAGDVASFTNGGSGDFQSNGGSLLVDTDFENGVSDRLVVDNVSVASGPTRVYIKPVGAVTPTTEEGINVVEVLGDSADDAFVLGNSMGRGLYSYQLGRGLSGQTEQNWYLRESDEIRGEVPMAGALGVLAGRTSLATLSTPHDRQREGDDAVDSYARRSGTRLVSRAVTLPESEQPARKGVWGRVFGQSNEFGSDGGTGAGYDASLWGAQAGIDLVASGSASEGRSYGGVYLGYATSRGDGLRGNNRLGNLKVNATSIGAYYTRYNSNGFYWDATAQYSRISDAELKYLGDTTRSEGSSYLASLEAGKQLNRESKYVAELQGQLLYQKTSIDEMRLADSTRFDVGSQSGVTGRLGVRLARNPHQGARVQPWVSANLWRTFNQDVRVSSLGESATTPAGGTTGEVELGISLVPQSSNGWSAYMAGGYQFDVSGSKYSGWKGTLGVRKGW